MTSAALVKHATIVELVAAFAEAESSVRHAYGLLAAAEERIDSVYSLGGRGVAIRPVREFDTWSDVDGTIEVMKRAAWQSIVERLELRRFMSIKKFAELEEQLKRGELPPITVESIADFADGFRAAAHDMHKAAVVEVFEWLRPRERDHVHRLKTNTELEVGRKVILSYAVEQHFGGRGFHVSYGGYVSQRLVALENVFNGLDGKGTTAKGWQSELERAIGKAPEGETPLFRYRCCKNRNLHLEFKRIDLLAKFNAIAGGKTLKPEAGVTKSPRGTQTRRPAPDTRTAAQRGAKELAFFETPPALADELVAMAGIRMGDVVLEPSAGNGALALAVRRLGVGPVIRCVEIDPARVERLRDADFVVIDGDFLELDGYIGGYEAFDVIVANPPFTARADVLHVSAMLRWLKPGGALVAVMSAGAMFRDDGLARELRRDVEERGGRFETLPDGSFEAAGTSVRTCVCVVPRRPA